MIEALIAFGVTMVVCLALFFYCWRIRHPRTRRVTSVQVSATPEEAPTEVEHGIKKNVVALFPTVKANELRAHGKEESQCPICLVEYEASEVLRQVPSCGHVFHTRCVDSWLKDQNTCPVCRIIVASSPVQPVQMYCRAPIPASVVTEELAAGIPSWVLVNRPLPLPPANLLQSETTSEVSSKASNSSASEIKLGPFDSIGGTGEYPLLKPIDGSNFGGGWGAVYLERGPYGLSFRSQLHADPIECGGYSMHSTGNSERWVTESFSFGISSSGQISSLGIAGSLDSPGDEKRFDFDSRHDLSIGGTAPNKSTRRTRDSRTSWSSRFTNSSWDFSQPMVHQWQVDCHYRPEESLEQVSDHPPLTISPEHCSFEFLPSSQVLEESTVLGTRRLGNQGQGRFQQVQYFHL